MRKTKIVCTIGPATDREGVLRQLMEKGVDVVRFNFSHGSYEEHEKRMKEVKAERERVDRPVAIMLDTKGPEIRIGTLKEGKVHLKEGDKLVLTANSVSIAIPVIFINIFINCVFIFTLLARVSTRFIIFAI